MIIIILSSIDELQFYTFCFGWIDLVVKFIFLFFRRDFLTGHRLSNLVGGLVAIAMNLRRSGSNSSVRNDYVEEPTPEQ
jgi:hypothetical protein